MSSIIWWIVSQHRVSKYLQLFFAALSSKSTSPRRWRKGLCFSSRSQRYGCVLRYFQQGVGNIAQDFGALWIFNVFIFHIYKYALWNHTVAADLPTAPLWNSTGVLLDEDLLTGEATGVNSWSRNQKPVQKKVLTWIYLTRPSYWIITRWVLIFQLATIYLTPTNATSSFWYLNIGSVFNDMHLFCFIQ